MARKLKALPNSAPALRATLRRSEERTFSGTVFDPSDPARKFTVELLVDGSPTQVQRADSYVHDLAATDGGDGCCGFSFSLPAATVQNGCVVEARLANLGTPIGEAIALGDPPPRSDPGGAGEFRGVGGLRFSGWLVEADERAGEADVVVDGELILRVRTSGWTQIGTVPAQTHAVRSFDFHLPDRFGDGRVHRIAMVTAKGETLAGGPLAFVAFDGGLQSALAKIAAATSVRQQGELFDLVEPMSVPFSRYAQWHDGVPSDTLPAPQLHCAVIMVGTGHMEDTLHSLEDQTHAEWVAAALPPAGNDAGFDPNQVRAFLTKDGRNCEFVVFGLSGTSFAPTALARLAAVFQEFASAAAVYGDVDIVGSDGTQWPLAFPAFDYERMLEQGYCAHLFAMRREYAQRALMATPTSLYRLFNTLIDEEPSAGRAIVHIPGSLGILPRFDIATAGRALVSATAAHLRARGGAAEVRATTGKILPAARIMRRIGRCDVTVVIPTRNRLPLLKQCIESIGPAVREVGARIMVVDNDSTDPETLAYLNAIDGGGADVLRAAGPFNFAQLNNLAAASADSEFLCLLNNDVVASDDEWLTELLNRIAPSDVGAVGAMLLYPSGVIQHGGVVLGPNFAATHAFNDRMAGDPGYGDMLLVAHQCSAVTAACLLTRRADFLAVGGLDEIRFPINFNDVDYCLKLAAAGKRIVWTPYARLAHVESASRGRDAAPDRKHRFNRELMNLRNRWGEVLVDDPYYNPTLSLDPIPFSALAWPLRNMGPRMLRQPVPTDIPEGF